MAKNNNTLVFNGLMQGMSWDLIKEAKDEIKRHLGEKPPTRKDILTDWIIGKDYMLLLLGNSYEEGGEEDNNYLSPWEALLKILKEGFLLVNEKKEDEPSKNDMMRSSGLFEGINKIAAPAVGGVANSLNYNDYWGNSSYVNKAAYGDSSADPLTSLFENISGTSLKRAKDEIEAKRQGNILNLNYGDNASLMSQIEAYNRSKTGLLSQLGDLTIGGGITDFLNSTGLGALHGTTVLPGWGTLGGAILGSLSWVGNHLFGNYNRGQLKSYILEANNDLARNDLIINYTTNLNQLLDAFTQQQHMTKNGGKLKKSRRFAEGGLLNTYNYGLEEVNAGGSHEENPNEGVVVSYAPDGLPNKVEEGETIHNDYVYSKRLEANEKVLKNNLLDKKYEGKSFADISKKLTEDRKKRPNDPISVRTNEENLNRLQDALEELKLDNKTREVKRFLGSLNNDLLNALQLEMMDEYEAYAEQLAQQQEAEDLAYQEELAALEGMFGRGGHLKQEGSLITATEPVYDAEGKIVGWKQPNASTEKVLNISGYNPNYEGALIYADDRNWFLRNITSPWNTWWNNLPSSEFSWAARNLTPIGYVDAAINGDTETLLERALFEGLLKGAKGAVKGFKEAKNASKAEKVATLAKRLEAASTLKGKTKTSNVVEMKPTLPAKGLEEGVSSKTVNMEGKEVASTEAAKLGSWLRRNWKPVTVVGGGLGLGIWGFNKLSKEKNPPYNPLIDPSAYNQFLDEENTRSNLLQTTNDINTIQHNTGDTSGDTIWVGGIPYNVNTGLEFEKGGHLFLERGHIGENPWVTLWKNITSPPAPVVPSQWITENIESVKHNSRNNRNNNTNNNKVRLAVSSAPMYTEIPFGFTYDSFALDDFYLESPLYKHMLSYELLKSEEEEEQPKVKGKKGTNIKATNLKVPNASLPSSSTTVPETYSSLRVPNYSIFGKYLITPEEVEGNTIGYRDVFGRLVPFGSLPYLIIPSPLVISSDTDVLKSGNLRPPQVPNKTTTLESPNYLSYLRYAPILGSLGLVLSDTLGLTNLPDYSNIDMYRRAVDNIGGVNFVPIGGYQLYTPIDREYIANQLLALAAAYNRSLNNTNPVGSYILGLINDAKVRDQIGDMYINAAAQDLKNKLAVAEYNRGINITNARNSLAAQSENARLRALRANEYLSIANMMNTERNTAEAARAANYLGLFTNIGNLGIDEMNRTMVNRNPALFYGMNGDGSIYFKNAFWGLSEDTQKELIEMLKNEGYTISEQLKG